MPSSSLSVEMTGEEARLFQSFQNVIRQAGKFEDSLDKSGQAAKKLSREERSLAREAKRAFEEARPPLERYNEKKRQLGVLLEKHKISQKEYDAALAQSKRTMDQAAQSGEKAFGAQQLGSLKNYVMGIASVTGAISLVKGGLQEVIRIGEEAAGRARGSIQDFGGLRQVAEGATVEAAQADFEGLVAKGRRVQAMGVDEGEAARIVFAGRSAGLSEADIMLMGQMRATGFAAPERIAQATSGLQTALGRDVGGIKEITAMGLAAAAPVAGTTAQDLLQASGRQARSGATLGIELPEMLAAMGEIARTEGVDTAQTQLRSLYRGLTRSEATGEIDLEGAGTLVEMVQAVDRMGLGDAELDTLFDTRAMEAYRAVLGGADNIQAMTGSIAAAPGQGLLARRMGLTEESLQAAIDRRGAQGRREVSEVGRGTQTNFFEQMLDERDIGRRNAGDDSNFEEWNAWSGRGLSRMRRFFGGQRAELQRMAEHSLRPFGPEPTAGMVQLLDEQREELGITGNARLEERLDRLVAKMERAADAQERAAEAGPAMVAPGEDR